MNHGMGQGVNPHTLRVGVIKDFVSSSVWIDEDSNIYNESKLYLKNKISGISILSIGLCERQIKLEKILGKNKYKKWLIK